MKGRKSAWASLLSGRQNLPGFKKYGYYEKLQLQKISGIELDLKRFFSFVNDLFHCHMSNHCSK